MEISKDDLIRLLQKGMNMVEIAAEMETSKTTITNYIRKYNLKDKYYHPSPRARPTQAPKPKPKPVVDACKTCRFRDPDGNLGIGVHCGYITFTGHMRGCSWKECTRYEPGNPRYKKKQISII